MAAKPNRERLERRVMLCQQNKIAVQTDIKRYKLQKGTWPFFHFSSEINPD